MDFIYIHYTTHHTPYTIHQLISPFAHPITSFTHPIIPLFTSPSRWSNGMTQTHELRNWTVPTVYEVVEIQQIASSASPTAVPTAEPTPLECPGPFPDHSACEGRIVWTMAYRPSSWYELNDVERSRCSIQAYWSIDGESCPPVPPPTFAL